MKDNTYIETIELTFNETSFKSATSFSLRMKHLIENALGDFAEVECISLKKKKEDSYGGDVE